MLAGLAIGDIVTAVAGKPLEEASVIEIGGLLRGPRPLEVWVLRGDNAFEISIE